LRNGLTAMIDKSLLRLHPWNVSADGVPTFQVLKEVSTW
jgi:hypothetical protein